MTQGGALYHVNPETREPGVCQASTPDKCRFGRTFNAEELREYESLLGAEFPEISKKPAPESSASPDAVNKLAKSLRRKYVDYLERQDTPHSFKDILDSGLSIEEQVLMAPGIEGVPLPLPDLEVTAVEVDCALEGDIALVKSQKGDKWVAVITQPDPLSSGKNFEAMHINGLLPVHAEDPDVVMPRSLDASEWQLVTNYAIEDGEIRALSEDEIFERNKKRGDQKLIYKKMAEDSSKISSAVQARAAEFLSAPEPFNEIDIKEFIEAEEKALRDNPPPIPLFISPATSFGMAVDARAAKGELTDEQLAYCTAYFHHGQDSVRGGATTERVWQDFSRFASDAKESAQKEQVAQEKEVVQKRGIFGKLFGATDMVAQYTEESGDFDAKFHNAMNQTTLVWDKNAANIHTPTYVFAGRILMNIQNTVDTNADLSMNDHVSLLRMTESYIPNILRSSGIGAVDSSNERELMKVLGEMNNKVLSMSSNTAERQADELRKELQFLETKISEGVA